MPKLHNDYRPENVLCDNNGRITGIVDWHVLRGDRHFTPAHPHRARQRAGDSVVSPGRSALAQRCQRIQPPKGHALSPNPPMGCR
ncbi:phosphotransferase [Actinopolymorpha rutila]|uniref:phosphotransferase n=1 Tax=Actinopolymorpha rutila TaxID=446787 RepID=UPI0015CA0581